MYIIQIYISFQLLSSVGISILSFADMRLFQDSILIKIIIFISFDGERRFVPSCKEGAPLFFYPFS